MAGLEQPGVTNVRKEGEGGGSGPAGEHALVGPLHTVSGLTPGQYLRATSPTGFAFAAILATDLPGEVCTDAEVVAAFAAHLAAADPHGQYILETEKGAANGVAPLGGAGELDPAYLPDATETAAGIVELATSGESVHGLVVQGDDARLSDSRDPISHAADHKHGGGDEVAQATSAANAVPKAGADGKLDDGWIPAGIARDSEVSGAVTAHEGGADPHAGYQKESERGTASGYAPLDTGSKVPGANLPVATTSLAGIVELATDGEGGPSLAVQANDGRLADARAPTDHAIEHQPGGGDAMAVDTAAGTGSLRTLGTGAAQAAVGSHGHAGLVTGGDSHDHSGGDGAQIDHTGLANKGTNTHAQVDTHLAAAAPHSGHEATANKGAASGYAPLDAGSKVPLTNLADATTATKGIIELAADGESAANLVPQANDGRLSNARTPTVHAATHQAAGGDAIKLDDLAVPDDNADLNAATNRHGLLAKLSGSTSQFLRGDGAWAAPPGGGGAVWGSITGTLTDQSDLDGALDAKATPADISAAVSAHEGAGNPHPGYATDGDLSAHTGAAAPHSGHVQVGGQLGGTAASPDVRGVRESAGPTLLTLGAVADGQYLKRSGATVVGDTPAGGGADPTLPTTAPAFVEDFVWASTETGEVGELGWSLTNGSIVAANAEANHPGILTRRSGTTAAQVASLYPGPAGTATRFQFNEFDVLYWIVALVTSGTDFGVRFGITADATSATPAHGAYIERLPADTSFFGVSRNGGVESRTAALLAQDLLWHKFRVRRISATQVGFQVDGGTEVVISASNIPDAADLVTPFLQITPTTTTARDIKADFFSLKLLAPAR